MSRKRTNRVKTNKPTAKDNLIQISSAVVYGLKFFNSYEETSPKRTFMKCKPTVTFDEEKLYIDYTNCLDSDSFANIENIFDNLTLGSTFTLSDALYQDPANNIETNLSATYVFMGLVNGTTIKAINETISLPSNVTVFKSKNFTRIPQMAIPSVKNEKLLYGVKNLLGQESTTSFLKLGAEKDYLVEFSGIENSKAFKIKDIKIQNDGSEILILKEKVVPENKFDSPVVVNILAPKDILDEKVKQEDTLRLIEDRVLTEVPDRFKTRTEALAKATVYRCNGYHTGINSGVQYYAPCSSAANLEKVKTVGAKTTKPKSMGPIPLDGYYPLYYSAKAAVAASPSPSLVREGETTVGYHIHVLRGKTFYMPNGLEKDVTFFHGDYYDGILKEKNRAKRVEIVETKEEGVATPAIVAPTTPTTTPTTSTPTPVTSPQTTTSTTRSSGGSSY
jgi:hypothetical protein